MQEQFWFRATPKDLDKIVGELNSSNIPQQIKDALFLSLLASVTEKENNVWWRIEDRGEIFIIRKADNALAFFRLLTLAPEGQAVLDTFAQIREVLRVPFPEDLRDLPKLELPEERRWKGPCLGFRRGSRIG